MAIIFAEGFDHYGTVQYVTSGTYAGSEVGDSTSRYNMLSGVWSEVPITAKVYYADDSLGGYPFTPRTGRGSLGFVGGGTGPVHLRRSLKAQKADNRVSENFIGIAFAVWMAQLPSKADTQVLVSFLDSRTFPNVALLLQPDGSLTINVPVKWASAESNEWLGDLGAEVPYGSNEIGYAPPGTFVAGTWNHIEFKVAIGNEGDPHPGQAYVRVNEIEVASISDATTIGSYSTGQYTQSNNDPYVSQVSFLYSYSASANQFPMFLDDIVCWDSTGPGIVNWIGDKNVVLEPLMFDHSDNGALANDWGVSGETNAKDAIDDFNDPKSNVTYPPPYYADPYYNGRDDDETYIVAENVDDTVEFQTDAPSTITDIDAVILVNSLRKTQASTTKVQVSLVDGVDEVLGADRAVAQDYTYYDDIFETAPDGSAWTIAKLNSAKVRLKRTA